MTLAQNIRAARQPNLLLLQARQRRRSPSGSGRVMSRQELSDEVNACLYGGSGVGPHVGGIDSKYIGKLERGVYRWPNENYRRAFRKVLNVASDADLGFFVTRRSRQELALATSAIQPTPSPLVAAAAVVHDDPASAPDGTDWPAWFGLRLARALSTVHSWAGAPSDALQTLLHQEILMFDASAPYVAPPAFETSRRQALITIAALPLALGTPPAHPPTTAAIELLLAQCGASLTACWHLLKGSDLDTVDRLLTGYLTQLQSLARRPSKYQRVAARLASQGHRISGIIALHRNHIWAREHYCKQAVEYAALARDVPSHVSALISLASTYFYQSDPVRAVTAYERALALDADMTPLQRSRTRAELAVIYGQLGRERETLASAELAEQLYPDLPEHDSSYLYAEFTKASLTLEQGLAYAALARRHPDRGYQQTAADIFSRIDRTTNAAIPDRIRYEIINHQASTAVLLGDLEAFGDYLTRGARGAMLLGSKQRTKEVQTAWRLANQAWPTEPTLKALGRELMPALNVPAVSAN